MELNNVDFTKVEKHSNYLTRYISTKHLNLEEKVLVVSSVLVDLCEGKEYMFNYVEQMLKSVIEIEREGK